VAFERVHTVSDYFDGPREGLADYCGTPHRYKSVWDKAADESIQPRIFVPFQGRTFPVI
jgi:hypothetical protein